MVFLFLSFNITKYFYITYFFVFETLDFTDFQRVPNIILFYIEYSDVLAELKHGHFYSFYKNECLHEMNVCCN